MKCKRIAENNNLCGFEHDLIADRMAEGHERAK